MTPSPPFSSPATARKISSSGSASAVASVDAVDRAEALEGRLIEVRDDGVDAPAADADADRVEGIELGAEGRPRLGQAVGVADPPEARLQRLESPRRGRGGPSFRMPTRVAMPSNPARSWVVRKTVVRAVGELADDLLVERAARDDVESERRVVEDEQLRAVSERQREHAPPPSGRARAGRTASSAERRSARGARRHGRVVPARVDAPAEVRELAGGHRRPARRAPRASRRCAPWPRAASSRSRRRREACGPTWASARRAGIARARTCRRRCGRAARRRCRRARTRTRPRTRSLVRSGRSGPRSRIGSVKASPPFFQAAASASAASSSVDAERRGEGARSGSRRRAGSSRARSRLIAGGASATYVPSPRRTTRSPDSRQALVGLRDRGGVDVELARQVPHRWDRGAGLERARGHEAADPFLDLAPDRGGVFRIDAQRAHLDDCISVLVH